MWNRKKPYRFRNLLLDVVMTYLTHGFWLIWVVMREVQQWQRA